MKSLKSWLFGISSLAVLLGASVSQANAQVVIVEHPHHYYHHHYHHRYYYHHHYYYYR